MKRLQIAVWEIVGLLFIVLVGSFLHFVYELSGFAPAAAVFGSVNESTWEHLKLFFWPGLVFALVQHAYIRSDVNNFWIAKAVALLLTPIGVIASFYFYLGIALPIYGEGFLWADIGTGVVGVALGQWASHRLLTSDPLNRRWLRLAAWGSIGVLTVAMVLFTWVTPRLFLFENFFGYEYSGEFGILDDYTPYLIFE